MEKIKVLVVDDHLLVRDGIVNMISSFADMEVVAAAGNAQEAIQEAEQLHPDIILMDINLRDVNGIEAARILKERGNNSRVLFLSMEASPEFLNDIIKLDAQGYILKDIKKDELAEAIRKVAAGIQYFSKGVSDMVFRQYYVKNSPNAPTDPKVITPSVLSERELEILKLIAEGYNKREIADQLFISPRTVDAHRANIMEKLQLKSTVELVKYAINNKIIQL